MDADRLFWTIYDEACELGDTGSLRDKVVAQGMLRSLGRMCDLLRDEAREGQAA